MTSLSNFSRPIKWIALGLLAYFFVLMGIITLQYVPFNPDIAFLQIKQTEVQHVPGYLTVFYIHVYSSMFVLLAGFSQFNNSLLRKLPHIHRFLGYIYVSVVLILSAPSGIFMGFHANGGIIAICSFMILGTLWFLFTGCALVFAIKGKIKLHKQLMYRSFALALSAITLRLWKVILVFLFHPQPMELYKIIAWLGWVPNLIFVELLLISKPKK